MGCCAPRESSGSHLPGWGAACPWVRWRRQAKGRERLPGSSPSPKAPKAPFFPRAMPPGRVHPEGRASCGGDRAVGWRRWVGRGYEGGGGEEPGRLGGREDRGTRLRTQRGDRRSSRDAAGRSPGAVSPESVRHARLHEARGKCGQHGSGRGDPAPPRRASGSPVQGRKIIIIIINPGLAADRLTWLGSRLRRSGPGHGTRPPLLAPLARAS